MNNDILSITVGIIVGISLFPFTGWLLKLISFEVHEETAVVITSFGRLVKVLREPGIHLWPGRYLPWNKCQKISLKRDYRTFDEIHVNDCRGTTVIVDLWIEFRIVSPENALFRVTDREKALRSLLTNSATAILGTFEFDQILANRSELSQKLKDDIRDETLRWGLEIDLVFISKLSLLPEVSAQLFDTVAARLEKAKADIDENGRLNADMLLAQTSARVAKLVAEAKGQYSLGVNAAYQRLRANPELMSAYQELYELSLIKPYKTITFHGFGDGEVSAMDAAMTTASGFDAANQALNSQPLA